MWLRPALRRAIFSPTARLRHLSTAVAPVEVTPSCIARLRALSAAKGHEVALKVMVDNGGCSGFQYLFSLEDAPIVPSVPDEPDAAAAPTDGDDDGDEGLTIVKPADDVTVIIDNLSMGFISGSKVDYVEEMISSSFRIIDNPNSESSCGCGVSFSAK